MKVDYNSVCWSEIVYYDPTSPTGLRWKVNKYCGRAYTTLVAEKDSVAGYIQKNKSGTTKSCVLKHNKISYKTHRIVWLINHGSISDDLFIDHLDQNPANNRIENLRLVTKKLNDRNRKKRKSNTSGVTGVFNSTMGNCEYVTSWVTVDGVDHSKRFSLSDFSQEKAFELAVEWRENKIKELNELGAGFTCIHGKK